MKKGWKSRGGQILNSDEKIKSIIFCFLTLTSVIVVDAKAIVETKSYTTMTYLFTEDYHLRKGIIKISENIKYFINIEDINNMDFQELSKLAIEGIPKYQF